MHCSEDDFFFHDLIYGQVSKTSTVAVKNIWNSWIFFSKSLINPLFESENLRIYNQKFLSENKFLYEWPSPLVSCCLKIIKSWIRKTLKGNFSAIKSRWKDNNELMDIFISCKNNDSLFWIHLMIFEVDLVMNVTIYKVLLVLANSLRLEVRVVYWVKKLHSCK